MRHKVDEKFYKVRIIKNGTFILESEDTLKRVWLGDRDLNLFFEPAEKREKIGREILGGRINEACNRGHIEE